MATADRVPVRPCRASARGRGCFGCEREHRDARNGQSSSEERSGLTTLFGAATGHVPRTTGTTECASGKRRTFSSELGTPPPASRESGRRKAPPRRDPDAASRSGHSAEPVLSGAQATSSRCLSQHGSPSPSVLAAGSIGTRERHFSTGTKTHGSIEQRYGGNAESLATDFLAA